MFRCDSCKNVSLSHQSQYKKVIETGGKKYYYLTIKKRKSLKKEYVICKNYEELESNKIEYKILGYEIIGQKETIGQEIVKELKVCYACHKNT